MILLRPFTVFSTDGISFKHSPDGLMYYDLHERRIFQLKFRIINKIQVDHMTMQIEI